MSWRGVTRRAIRPGPSGVHQKLFWGFEEKVGLPALGGLC